MAIVVVCRGCKKRFSVSDKFAGQKGPCPNCKTVIEIPKKEDEVVVHAPEEFGPRDSAGRPVLKPIERTETQMNATLLVSVLAGIAVVFFIALVMRGATIPLWFLGLGAAALGPPLAVGGYVFLRDDELEPYRGASLWIRASACGLVYAIIWGVVAFINSYLFDGDPFELPVLMVIIPLMVVAGAGVAVVSLDLDFTTSLIHYGLYLGTTVLLRLTMGLNPIGPRAEETIAAWAKWTVAMWSSMGERVM